MFIIVKVQSLLYAFFMGLILCFIPLIIYFLILTFVFKIKVLHQLIAILLGLVAVFPIALIQYFLPDVFSFIEHPLLRTLLKSLIVYGLIEEIIKMLMVIPLPHKNYSELKFLLLAFLMGLSLGCFESLVYFLDHLQMAKYRGADLLYGLIFTRIFSTDIIHFACTGLGALFIYSCRDKNKKFSILILAVVLHGLYDFFAGFQNSFKWFAIPVILLALIECRIIYINQKNLCENRLTIFY